ncbi:hypothetical protein ACS0TY_009279 [Phlomoides rotata]
MLTNGKVKVDFVLANINSPDLHGFKLLQVAINLSIPIILMSVDDNAHMATRAVENGAYLYVKKPVTIELLRCIWQHVMRENIRVRRERQVATANYNAARGIEIREVNPNPNLGQDNMLTNDALNAKKGYNFKGRKDDIVDEYDSDNVTSQGGDKVRRKVCTEWTQDLHEKFMNAVEILGEGRCFPKEILDLMNVPGLTRMQVASHLQKCRNDNWRSPDDRKTGNGSSMSEGSGSQQKLRRFGSMPRLGRSPVNQVHQNNGAGGEGSKTGSESVIPNDGVVENIGNIEGTMMPPNTTAYPNQQYAAQPNATTFPNQHYGSLVPHQSNIANPRQFSSAEDYYYYPDVDYCLLQNYGVPRGNAGMEYPHPSFGVYQFEPVYGHDQVTNYKRFN